jgi:hypothetical protein
MTDFLGNVIQCYYCKREIEDPYDETEIRHYPPFRFAHIECVKTQALVEAIKSAQHLY